MADQSLVQIRVSPETKNQIKAAAAREGMSIKEYLLTGASHLDNTIGQILKDAILKELDK